MNQLFKIASTVFAIPLMMFLFTLWIEWTVRLNPPDVVRRVRTSCYVAAGVEAVLLAGYWLTKKKDGTQ